MAAAAGQHTHYPSIAKRLGLSPETVKERVRRMESEGVLVGFEAYPNPRHLGMGLASYLFRVPAKVRRNQILDDTTNVEGVTCCMTFVGQAVCTDIAHHGPDDLARKVKVLGRLMGDAKPFAMQEYPFPPVARALSELDWRIVQCLRGQGRVPLDEVASDLGVSTRTVKRHYDRMIADGSLDIIARVFPFRAVGVTPFVLHIALEKHVDVAGRAAIVAAFEDNWFYQYSPHDAQFPCVTLQMTSKSAAEQEELRLTAESLPGVDHAETLIPTDMRGSEDWLDEGVAARLDGTLLSRVAAPSR